MLSFTQEDYVIHKYIMLLRNITNIVKNGECDKCRAEFKANYIKSMGKKYLISK